MKKHIFRVWDNDHNKYFEPTYEAWKGKLEDLHLGLSGDLFMRTMDGMTLCDDVMPGRFVIEHATHTLDINQKVIHEGDIVVSETYSIKATVVERFYDTWSPFEYYMDPKQDFEIIGNIHQNPELIK